MTVKYLASFCPRYFFRPPSFVPGKSPCKRKRDTKGIGFYKKIQEICSRRRGITHEKKVERFYSTGLKSKKKLQYLEVEKYDQGFLCFGYWQQDTRSYLEAANNLVDYFIQRSGLKKGETGKILDIACGYGTETFVFNKRLKPESIYGLDITPVHVAIANQKAAVTGLAKRVKFLCGDAVDLDEHVFPDNSYDAVLGIEGPAHFNPRERFFYAAHRVLKKGGKLLLTDIVLGKKFDRKKRFLVFLLRLVAKAWVFPSSNWVDQDGYRLLLEKAGFHLEIVESIGNKVFPSFAANCFTRKAVKTRIAHRGVAAVVGLNLISYFLGYFSRKGWIDYIFVKSQKI